MKEETKKNVLLAMAALLFWFILFEIAVRLFWEEPGYGYPEGLHIPDETKGIKYQPLFKGDFQGKIYGDIEIEINSNGLRDYEHDHEKPEGSIRILGLGDSVTFGAGVRFENTYLRQLENKFLENGSNAEIIKAGVDGYEFDQEYTYYFEEGYKYHPDIVLIGLVLNDPRIINPGEVKENLYNWQNPPPINKIRRLIGENLKSIKFTVAIVTNLLRGRNYNDEYFFRIYSLWDGGSFRRYRAKVLEINKNITESGAALVLVIFPYTQQFSNSLNYGRLPQEKIISLAEEINITAIDLTNYLDLPNYKDYYLPYDTVHLNEKGHKLVAEILYSKIKDMTG